MILDGADAQGGVFELLAGPFLRDELTVVSFRGKESLSHLFRFDITFTTDRDPELLEPALLVQPATFVVHTLEQDGRSPRGCRCSSRIRRRRRTSSPAITTPSWGAARFAPT